MKYLCGTTSMADKTTEMLSSFTGQFIALAPVFSFFSVEFFYLISGIA
jgi:hypothetical protein